MVLDISKTWELISFCGDIFYVLGLLAKEPVTELSTPSISNVSPSATPTASPTVASAFISTASPYDSSASTLTDNPTFILLMLLMHLLFFFSCCYSY